MESLLSICTDQNEEESMTMDVPSKPISPAPLTPVQNSITLRLQKLMSEKKICLKMDTNAEIDLNDEDDENVEFKKSPIREPKNPLDEWFRKRTPKASPANKKKKLSLLKKELLDKMIAQRREEQESRRRVFRADNEIFDDNDDEEEGCSEIDEEESTNNVFKSKKDKRDALEDEQSDNDYLASDENENSDCSDDQESENEVENEVENESELPQDENDFIDDKASNFNDEDSKTERPLCRHGINFELSDSNSGMDDKNSNSCGLSQFLNNENESVEKEFHPTTSTISLHKTESISQIGSQFLCAELDSQPINSQQLANEMENLMAEQNRLEITELENYQLLLDLTKFDKEPTINVTKSSQINDEEDNMTNKKLSKRKRQIQSDDEEESLNEDFPTTPSSGVTKLPKIVTFDTDQLFQIDDGEDRLEMDTQSKPFFDTLRVRFDDENSDDDFEFELEQKKKVSFGLESQDNESEIEFEEEIDGGIEENGEIKSKNKLIDDEASLSGSDLGSADELEEKDMDIYEPMEGDNDELPDEHEIREGIIKTHMKLQNIDEERNLNKLKEMFDAEINPSNQWDRSFRSRLHEQELDFKSLIGDPLNMGNSQSDDDEVEEIITFKDHLERKEAEEKEEENRRIFTLASFADDLSQENIDEEASLSSKNFTHNPNGIAKFIVDNYDFQQDDSNTIL